MTYEEALSYLNSCGWSKTNLGLSRTRELLAAIGDPQKRLRFVHVAGTNGKGSTCAMLAAVLQAAGYCTGLYTSPYIQDFRERIQVNGQPIKKEALAGITERVRDAADKMADHPTHFEMVTAIGMEYFSLCGCDIVVLEVGMGGEYDSTNVIDAPEVAVITNIGLDHTEYLGDTVEKIAATKGGIIKPGCNCVCYNGDPGAVSVIRQICKERGVPFTVAQEAKPVPCEPGRDPFDGQSFEYLGQKWDLRLLGPHQLGNVAVVMEVLGALKDRGLGVPKRALRLGLSQVHWPARFEVLRRDPLFILDGGHNPQCAQALAACLDAYLPGRKVIFLMGMLGDKDYGRVLDTVAPYAEQIICIRPKNPRALDPERLAEEARRRGADAEAYEDTAQAVRVCREMTGPVVAFGSLYAAGEIRTLMGFGSGE